MRAATPNLTATGLPASVPLVTCSFWQTQPQDATVAPLGTLPLVQGTFTDDATRPVQRQMSLDLAYAPDGLEVGNWVRVVIGLRSIAGQFLTLPVMVVTSLSRDNARQGGASLTASDPAEVLNGRPYEADTTLTGTLRSLVQAACDRALSRATDVSAVPDLAIPAETIAEFGVGSWDACLKAADALGIVLRFTDAGDVVGHPRSDPAPTPVTEIERVLVPPGGQGAIVRYPSAAVVLVTRGQGVEPLYGRADAVPVIGPLPAWYRPFVVTERHEGDSTTTQVAADQLALDLLKVRLGDQRVFSDLSILPAPWLESSVDTVSLAGATYWVRGVSVHLPTLATTVSLRLVVQ